MCRHFSRLGQKWEYGFVADYRVTLRGRLRSTSGPLDASATEALHVAMVELKKLGARDAAIMLNMHDDGALVIFCTVQVAEIEDAVPPARVDIRTALLAAEIGTPNFDGHRWQVEFIGEFAELAAAAAA